MEREKRILDEVEKTLNALDNVSKLDENPFLYTRLKLLIEKEHSESFNPKMKDFILKPAVLVIILIINIITALFFLQVTGSKQSTATLSEQLKNDYQVNQIQYQDLKLE